MKKKLFILLGFIMVTLFFGIGTEIYARMANYHPSLGSPHILGRYYQPFHILYWLVTMTAQPNVLATSLGTAVTGSFGSIITILYFYYTLRPKNSGTYGTSRWANEKEIKRENLYGTTGAVLGQSAKAKIKKKRDGNYLLKKKGKLLRSGGAEHILVSAPTRRGKGISVVIPSLLAWNESVLVYDLKGENYEATSGWRGKFSYSIKFEPANPQESVRWNPLLEIDKGPREVAQAQSLAETISDPNGEDKSDHWSTSAKQLLIGLILHVLYDEQIAYENKNLSSVYSLLNSPGESPRQVFTRILDYEHTSAGPHPQIAQAMQNMLNREDKELSSVISTTSSYLQLYQDPRVALSTSTSDFRIKDLMNLDRPVSLFLVITPNESDRMRPLTRLLLKMAAEGLTTTLGDYKHRLLFLIDEFPTLGTLPFFERQLGFTAGYGIKTLLICQSYNQLFKIYGNNTSIPDNCRYKVILGADSPNEAELVAKFLGQETVTRRSVSKSAKVSAFFAGTATVSESEQGRSLLTADEVMRLDFKEALLIVGSSYPYKMTKLMYFLDKRFKKRANLPVPEITEENTLLQQARFGELPTEKTKNTLIEEPKSEEQLQKAIPILESRQDRVRNALSFYDDEKEGESPSQEITKEPEQKTTEEPEKGNAQEERKFVPSESNSESDSEKETVNPEYTLYI